MKKYISRGVRLKQNKSDIILAPIVDFGMPESLSVCIPYRYDLLVREGDLVMSGQALAQSVGEDVSRYCPCDATVAGISTYLHPEAGTCYRIVLVPQVLDIAGGAESGALIRQDGTFSADDLSGLIDRLDGKPLTAKIRDFMHRGVKMIAVNAVDDQPYVCPSAGLVKHHRDEIVRGLELLCAICDAKAYHIFLYGSKSFALYDFTQGLSERPSDTIFIGGKYPARAVLPEQCIKNMGFVGAQTCIDILQRLTAGRNQTHTVVTVAGELIGAPANLRAPIGTPVGALIDACSPSEEHGMVILGGPMTGVYVKDLSAPVDLSTEAVLFLRPSTISKSANCWGCAECVSVCPRGLMPLYIARFAKHERYDDALALGAARCIECGCCSYVCSGGIDPMSFISKAKKFGEISVAERAHGEKTLDAPLIRPGSAPLPGPDDPDSHETEADEK